MPGRFDQGWRRIIVAASGPSFSPEQAAMVERARQEGLCRVLAINTQALTTLPNADAMYAADMVWWRHYGGEVKARFRGQLYTSSLWNTNKWTPEQKANLPPNLQRVRVAYREGLSRETDTVNSGENSGYQGMGVGYLLGACCEVLVGFDMQRTGGKTHNHGDHPNRMWNGSERALAVWVPRFNALGRDLEAAGVCVVNCSAATALTAFPRATLEEVLEAWRE